MSISGQTPEVTIELASSVTDELVQAWARLLPQVSRSASPIGREELVEIIDSPATFLFMARDESGYVGSLTLAVFRIPDGLRAWIEDVVVDESARGRGIGMLLNQAAIEYAEGLGVRSIDLTSNPKREAANRLYLKLGFEARDTSVFRYKKG